MSHQRVKLSKKLFMSLKPGQYIMGNFMPLTYEEIGTNPEEQWDNWSMVNGNSVDIFNSKEDCLRLWWELNSGFKGQRTTKTVHDGKLSKKVFLAQPNGYCLLFMHSPFDSLEFQETREAQWQAVRHANGRRVQIYKNQSDCVNERNRLVARFSS